MKKLIVYLGCIGFVAGLVAFAPAAMAANVTVTVATGGGAVSADTVAGAWTTLGPIVITETAVGDITAGAGITVILTVPTGFEFNTVAPPDAVATGADITAITTPVGATATKLTLTFTAAAAVTMDTITIGGVTPIQIRPTAKNLPTGNIVRTLADGGTAVIAGLPKDSTVNLGTLTEVPGPITILSCISSGSAGAVWLRWTNPGGDPKTVYDVRTSLAAINAGNYATATAFTQTWPVVTEGNVSQQLVNALTPNNIYHFAMKSNSANGLSAISTGTVYCTAPTAYPGNASDTTAPTSTITSPTYGLTILVNQSYTVKGTAMDTGGSSVQKLEISLDDGVTWSTAVITDVSGDNSLWEYAWSNLAVGEYVLKTKATDWCNNVETPGIGITVTVATELPTTTTPPTTTPPTVTPPTEKPITEMTVPELRTKIAEIQQQIIDLLFQFIQILQDQLAQL